jgi:hypothetical protein
MNPLDGYGYALFSLLSLFWLKNMMIPTEYCSFCVMSEMVSHKAAIYGLLCGSNYVMSFSIF